MPSTERRVMTIITEGEKAPSDPSNQLEQPKREEPPAQANFAESLLRGDQELRATVASNFIRKSLIGIGVGLATGIFIFRRKAVPTTFGAAFGLGMAYAEGRQMVLDYHETIRQTTVPESPSSRYCPYLPPRRPPPPA